MFVFQISNIFQFFGEIFYIRFILQSLKVQIICIILCSRNSGFLCIVAFHTLVYSESFPTSHQIDFDFLFIY